MDTEQIARARALFESRWSLVKKVVGHVSRRHHLSSEDAEELLSYVALKLVDDDYRILRRFQGRSSLRTYLTTVVLRLYLDYRHRQWGKWRPSARARRLGAAAVHLDKLIYRDGYSLEEAVQILRTNFRLALSRKELEDMATRLPEHTPVRRFESDAELRETPVDGRVDERLMDRDRAVACQTAQAVLQSAIGHIKDKDRLILKMRFEDAMTAPQIAAALRVKQRFVYGRIERCLKKLRAWLEGKELVSTEIWDALSAHGPEIRVSFLGRDE